MELGTQIIFFDRSAVRLKDNVWIEDDRYMTLRLDESEAGRFLAEIEETARRAAKQ
jgi:hypothetical protein